MAVFPAVTAVERGASGARPGRDAPGTEDLAIVVRYFRVHRLAVARAQQPVRTPDGVVRAPVRPVGVLLRLQVGLEDQRQHEHRRRLRHPVPYARNAQGPELPMLLLWNEHLPNRVGPASSCFQIPRQFPMMSRSAAPPPPR